MAAVAVCVGFIEGRRDDASVEAGVSLLLDLGGRTRKVGVVVLRVCTVEMERAEVRDGGSGSGRCFVLGGNHAARARALRI